MPVNRIRVDSLAETLRCYKWLRSMPTLSVPLVSCMMQHEVYSEATCMIITTGCQPDTYVRHVITVAVEAYLDQSAWSGPPSCVLMEKEMDHCPSLFVFFP
jgi:hypothetical protein